MIIETGRKDTCTNHPRKRGEHMAFEIKPDGSVKADGELKDWRGNVEVGSAFIEGNQCIFTKADQTFEINHYLLTTDEVKLLKMVYEDAVKLGHIEE
jgi:hypothetical protein